MQLCSSPSKSLRFWSLFDTSQSPFAFKWDLTYAFLWTLYISYWFLILVSLVRLFAHCTVFWSFRSDFRLTWLCPLKLPSLHDLTFSMFQVRLQVINSHFEAIYTDALFQRHYFLVQEKVLAADFRCHSNDQSQFQAQLFLLS